MKSPRRVESPYVGGTLIRVLHSYAAKRLWLKELIMRRCKSTQVNGT